MEPILSLEEAKERVAEKTAPKVTEADIKAKIRSVEYLPIWEGGTICVIRMANGWISTGFSAPASPDNFDPEVGKRYAYEQAFRPLWQLEGYLLRTRLQEGW